MQIFDLKIPTNPDVTWGKYQCWGCANREGYTSSGLPICKTTQEIMLTVYEPCSAFKSQMKRGDE